MKAGSPQVRILLSCYNGERFLVQQLDSLLGQHFNDWQLLIRDDGSSDATLEILREYCSRDQRMRLIGSGPNLGPAQSFEVLMRSGLVSGGDWFLFCDQDDTWSVDKVATLLDCTGSLDPDSLHLIHSDLSVVDDALELKHGSFVRYAGLMPTIPAPFAYLLTRNFVTGAAAMFSRGLAAAALPFPESIVMHDWWLALICAAAGEIRFVDAPLVQYRQHGGNAVGARGVFTGLNPLSNWVQGWKRGNAEYLAALDQAREACRWVRKNPRACAESGAAHAASLFEEMLRAASPLERVRLAREIPLRSGDGLLQLIFLLRLASVTPVAVSER